MNHSRMGISGYFYLALIHAMKGELNNEHILLYYSLKFTKKTMKYF
jgi:hypothetical protein